MLVEHDRLTPGVVSMVSQSGGIGVMAHARAQEFGLGFRVTISCGNEVALGIADFIRALVLDEGTRVIAVYMEGLSNPAAFVEALAEARARRKPVVILKGGGTEASGRAALAHTGRLAGSDRTYDAIFREFAAIRVYSSEELLDVCLQLASFPHRLAQRTRWDPARTSKLAIITARRAGRRESRRTPTRRGREASSGTLKPS